MSFFVSFLYQELQVIWQPQIRSHMLWCPCMAWVTRYNNFHMVLDSHRCCNSFEDVRDNCFCAYLLRTQIHTPRHGSMRALSNKMKNDRADGHCYSFALFFFPYFVFWWIIFSTDLRLEKKWKKNLSTRSLTFLQNALSNSVILSSSFICAAVSNASWRVKFCEDVGNIWNYLRNRPNFTKYD